MTAPALDLTKRHFVHPHLGKGITAWGSWWRNSDGTYRPCLVLTPPKVTRSTVPCVILLEDAFKWNIEDRDLSERQRRACQLYISNAGRVFAESLGLGDSKLAVATVINVVHDELGELLSMPPLPPGELIVRADATITDQDGRQRHFEVTDRV